MHGCIRRVVRWVPTTDDYYLGTIIFASVFRNVLAPVCFLLGTLALFPICAILEQLWGLGYFSYTARFCGSSPTSAFVSWVHRAHRHCRLNSCSSDVPQEHFGPGMRRKRYPVQDLAIDYLAFWDSRKEQGLQKIQEEALVRWRSLEFVEIGTDVSEDPFPLGVCLSIFDDLFFLGALSRYTKAGWTSQIPRPTAWMRICRKIRAKIWMQSKQRSKKCNCETIGLATLVSPLDLLWWPETVRIEMLRQTPKAPQVWTKEDIAVLLGILLHEMAHSFIQLYSCPVEGYLSSQKLVESDGWTGHGPAWQDIAATIEKKANGFLGERFGTWNLYISIAQAHEAEAVREALEKWSLHLGGEVLEKLPGYAEGLRLYDATHGEGHECNSENEEDGNDGGHGEDGEKCKSSANDGTVEEDGNQEGKDPGNCGAGDDEHGDDARIGKETNTAENLGSGDHIEDDKGSAPPGD